MGDIAIQPLFGEDFDQFLVVAYQVGSTDILVGPPGRPRIDVHYPRWVLVMSGVVTLHDPGVQGESTKYATTGTVNINFDLTEAASRAGVDVQNDAVGFVVETYPGTDSFGLPRYQAAALGTLANVYDAHESVDASYAVNRTEILTGPTGANNQFNNAYLGLAMDLEVRDSDAYIKKLGFYVTLVGRWVTWKTPPIM